MVSKELKKLSRRELVDIIYQMKKNEQQLQEEVASLQAALQDKRIRIEEAGSVAAAALSITDVLGAAQRTADLYLHEITCMKEDTEQACREARRKCQQLQEEIQMLEEKKRELYEDLEHGKEV